MLRLPRGLRRSTKVILTLSVVMCLSLVLIGAKKTPIPEDLGDKYKTWLEAVELIITKEERDAFLAIKKDTRGTPSSSSSGRSETSTQPPPATNSENAMKR